MRGRGTVDAIFTRRQLQEVTRRKPEALLCFSRSGESIRQDPERCNILVSEEKESPWGHSYVCWDVISENNDSSTPGISVKSSFVCVGYGCVKWKDQEWLVLGVDVCRWSSNYSWEWGRLARLGCWVAGIFGERWFEDECKLEKKRDNGMQQGGYGQNSNTWK